VTSLLAVEKTIPDLFVFFAGALMILAGAIGVIAWRNPVHSALSLVLTLFGVAVLFIEQQAEFLAAVQVIVYAGAIVVLFLFVIMFLGVDRTEDLRQEPLIGQRVFAGLLVLVVVVSVIALGTESSWLGGAHSVVGPNIGPYQNVNSLGRAVFTTYLFAFEATAALLIIAVVGAVVLARRTGSTTSDDELGSPEPEASVAAAPSDGADDHERSAEEVDR
jgi:NADH-quinone oxidoreductase subunit J